jgi:hypothetical protein
MGLYLFRKYFLRFQKRSLKDIFQKIRADHRLIGIYEF